MTYDSIYILPIRNYDRYYETREPKWLESDFVVKNIDYEKIWDVIQDEVIDKIGMDAQTKAYQMAINELIVLEIDYELTGDRSIKNDIRDLEKYIEENKPGENNQSVVKNLIEISHVLGFQINPSITTVSDYIDYIDSAKKISNEHKKDRHLSGREAV